MPECAMRRWYPAHLTIPDVRWPRTGYAPLAQWPQGPVARILVSTPKPVRVPPAAPDDDLLRRLREAGL